MESELEKEVNKIKIIKSEQPELYEQISEDFSILFKKYDEEADKRLIKNIELVRELLGDCYKPLYHIYNTIKTVHKNRGYDVD